jgi:valyl-tRNA synthetase
MRPRLDVTIAIIVMIHAQNNCVGNTVTALVRSSAISFSSRARIHSKSFPSSIVNAGSCSRRKRSSCRIPSTFSPTFSASSFQSTSIVSCSSTTSTSTHEYDVRNRLNGLVGSYNPAAFESEIYQWWESSGCFQPDAKQSNRHSTTPAISSTENIRDTEKKSAQAPYVLPMPPPNVTGRLHMGHAIFVALQDILARFHRMRGRSVLWTPGTDHAGIATQLQVEKLLHQEGTTREHVGREEFLRRVWMYKEEQGGHITRQLRSLGASADWTRERFTMDESLCEAVTEAFVRLHEKGLVYRGEYMVNWAPLLQTAVSDLEVEYSEEEGKLYYFKYMIEGSNGMY